MWVPFARATCQRLTCLQEQNYTALKIERQLDIVGEKMDTGFQVCIWSALKAQRLTPDLRAFSAIERQIGCEW